MRAIAIIAPSILLALSACNFADKPKQEEPKAAAQQDSGVSDTYVRIRKLASVGELNAAAQLTDDPAAYMDQMTTAIASLGEVRFQENMKNSALKSNIHAEKSHGDFVMLIVNYSFEGVNDKAANFFRKKDGRFVEMVNADDRVPCQLVRDFYDAKGEKDAEIGNCTETEPAKATG